MFKFHYCNIPNFGDQLNQTIFDFYDIPFVHSEPEKAQVFCVGSVLDRAPESFYGYVLGSGFMSANTRKSFYNAKILALRGRYTAERILTHNKQKHTFFDPGILISNIITPQKKTYPLGIVLHSVDENNLIIGELLKKNPEDILLIDPKEHVDEVCKKISSCEAIASSSLHGIIIAHSYNIPATWLLLSNKVIGGGFKFFDYMSAYNEEINPWEGSLSSVSAIVSGGVQAPRALNERAIDADSIFRKFASTEKTWRNASMDTDISAKFKLNNIYRRINKKIILATRKTKQYGELICK
jgi:pyruvyltransferase